MGENSERRDILPYRAQGEGEIELASILTSVIPWAGGPISAVLSGISQEKKWERVKDVLISMGTELEGFKSEVAEKYVRTDQFQELFEKALRQAGNEFYEDKRKAYANFLAQEIKGSGNTYDEGLRILRIIEELQPDHLVMLRAINSEPSPEELNHTIGSPLNTLKGRLLTMTQSHIVNLVDELNDLRIIRLERLSTMMTPQGAADLRSAITPLGQKLLKSTGIEVKNP
jgi:hypothetical protein